MKACRNFVSEFWRGLDFANPFAWVQSWVHLFLGTFQTRASARLSVPERFC